MFLWLCFNGVDAEIVIIIEKLGLVNFCIDFTVRNTNIFSLVHYFW